MKLNLSSRVEHYLGLVALLVFFHFFVLTPILSHIFPPDKPVNSSVYVEKINKLETEINGLHGALKTYAESKGTPPAYQRPAINLVEKSGLCFGLNQTQCGIVLSALKAKTVQTIAVNRIAPSPAPTPSTEFDQRIYRDAYSADTHALNETKQNVVISSKEVPRSKIGSYLAPAGQGISYEFWSHGQTALEIAGFQAGTHIAPALALHYKIPHTVLSVGPSLELNHGLKFDFSAVVGF